MHRSILIHVFLGGLLLVCSAAFSQTRTSSARPNIILIMADDLGYSDIGCYGGEIRTPNLDKLAAGGLRFSRFYNTSRCCPTRAALLTGQYNHNAGIGEMTTDRHRPGYRGALGRDVVTIAEVLKEAGYRTAMSGKWHVSNTIEEPTPQAQLDWLNHKTDRPLFSPIDQYPLNRGFEKYFGTIWGVVDFFDPFSLVSGTEPVKQVPDGYYHTDAINDTAAKYVREFSKGKQPFFIYVAQNAPHWPLQAKPADIEKYKNTYTQGWDAIREARYAKLVQYGLIDPKKAPLSPRVKNDLSWENNPDKAWDARAMAVHAAMVDCMDQGIGRIVAALKETGELDNTLIVFLSDNGASPEDCSRYGKGFDRPGETRDGKEIVYPKDKKTMPGPQTTFASIGERWANVANTPYQYAKMESYEGGVRTPMIAYWPAGIKNKGKIAQQTGHVMDFMATFIELAGATYPAEYNGNKILPQQGRSLVTAFKGGKSGGHEYLFNEHFNARYARSREWKLVSLTKDTTWRLYRITEDETELNDLAAQYPEVVKDLQARWRQWAAENRVLPKR
ncbi:arylsulfatase [Chitinophaga sp. GCM10012297]|uniref:Arylsulfatase n=1 Tax=Chitinophaga chungangae TaxID=2821488 RepID=A0ABS3YC12_9BACT|nr:arylsulfatase [Chitinophaga chungangae]MBO9152222.1 arylsulfatase [Chitinophaga chungangae]